MRWILVVTLLSAAAPSAFADEDTLRLMLLRELGSEGLAMRNGELPINMTFLTDTIRANRAYVKAKVQGALPRLVQLVHEDPASVTEAHFADAGFDWLFNDEHVGATMGHRTPEMRAAFLKTTVLAFRGLTRAPSQAATAHPLPQGEIYPSQLHGLLGIAAPTPTSVKPTRMGARNRSPAVRAPRR